MKENQIKTIIETLISDCKVDIMKKENHYFISIKYDENNKITGDIQKKINDEINELGIENKIIYIIEKDHQSGKIENNSKQDQPIQDKTLKTKPKKIKKNIPGVKKIILVASGKGGVGKSTIAANTATSLAKLGWRVGLLDADIYGASIPTIFNITNYEIDLDSKAMMIPLDIHGIKINSIEFITKNNEALIWRGPMISKVLDQLIQNTNWTELDYLIIDTPPGTGDIHITLLENYTIDGFILVSTPHQISINNSSKTLNMFKKFNIPNLTSVINMSWLDKDDQRKSLFQSGDLIAIKDNSKIIEIPFITNNIESLFSLNEEFKKYFIEIARNIVRHDQ